MMLDEAVGRRVCCDGERGTVRYVGPVPPTAGVWLGVEWDHPERGKHDGSHDGVRYFTCRHPTGGSFVRPQKASFGVDYVTALKQRYEVEIEEVTAEEMKISSKTVVMVGFENVKKKQSVKNLTEVGLRRCEVSAPGPENEIRNTTPFVQSLDLSGNLLSSWEVLAAITEQLDSLQELHLSHNRLSISSAPSSLSSAFSHLRVLSINSCALTWTQVLHCAPMWQQVEELYLADNNITELLRPEHVLQALTVLDLSNNQIAQETVLEISHLPRLERLNLSSTSLSEIKFSDVPAGKKTTLFPALKELLLDDNNISEWRVVNELEKLPSLVYLSCRRNPLLHKEKNLETARQIMIARLGQLELLDMRQILSDERRGAELDYCKMFGSAWLRAGGHREAEKNNPNTDFMTEHPRYLTLIQKYGAPDEGELREQKPFALKNQLLTITFLCPEDLERKPIEKKLPGSMIVQKVKGLLHRLLKLPGVELKLTYTCAKMADREIEIDNDLKPLQFYSVEDGDKILVRWS
ncbi:tubulin-specific chaperone E isoform X1 [Danio rerio]|uniref:Tubulin-specific chaperone E n=5 Tax=Danio rerio TaxID=7955 RepID=TBCE_DANRE|nr:tubulin-specific chaperone E [Danio rerio]XP_005155982.1 tubulin-specific chaperone E isoform X1 [Danio rerio]Q5U378.2 RecName: Full=Tubulin-specific chaperone E; AltName: Full=Tubulin-folding cofactor E [Danio rerio]|eukprot:NP_001035078.2 tubulin-specific chaperone E [Danio rerio]